MPVIRGPMSITFARDVCERDARSLVETMWTSDDFFCSDPIFALETAVDCLARGYLITPKIYILEKLVGIALKWDTLKVSSSFRKSEITAHTTKLRRYLIHDNMKPPTISLATILTLNPAESILRDVYNKWIGAMFRAPPKLDPTVWRGLFRPGIQLCLQTRLFEEAEQAAAIEAANAAAREDPIYTDEFYEDMHEEARLELGRNAVIFKAKKAVEDMML